MTAHVHILVKAGSDGTISCTAGCDLAVPRPPNTPDYRRARLGRWR